MASLTRHGWVAEAGRTPEQVDEAERRLRRSGPTKSHSERLRATGGIRIDLHLSAEAGEALDSLRGDETRTAYLEALVLRTARRKQKST